LTPPEKERIYRDKLRGRTLPEIAADLDCSVETARKWWRYAREHGPRKLQSLRRGRPPTGILSRFAPAIIIQALAFKRSHRRWGPNRVLVELRRDPTLPGLALPSPSRLAVLFKAECPDCVAVRHPRKPAASPPPRPTAVHECWQLDMQEAIPLVDDRQATICTIRDPVSAVILAAQAFDVTSGQRGRKLTWQEVRLVIRTACGRWGTLPDAIQTDNEVCLGGQPSDPLPSHLTLWLVGLGIRHQFIRPGTPTDQAQIERTHRTLDNFADLLDQRFDLATLQQRLDLEREQHNGFFPSRASNCRGRPPLLAHPEVLVPRRPYRPEWERQLFDLQQVYAYLATLQLQRKVSQVGQIQLAGRSVGVGRASVGQTVIVGCDPIARVWVVRDRDENVLARLPVQGVDLTMLTGLPDEPPIAEQPVQLMLPWFIA
jgi:transposase InsO family protein